MNGSLDYESISKILAAAQSVVAVWKTEWPVPSDLESEVSKLDGALEEAGLSP